MTWQFVSDIAFYTLLGLLLYVPIVSIVAGFMKIPFDEARDDVKEFLLGWASIASNDLADKLFKAAGISTVLVILAISAYSLNRLGDAVMPHTVKMTTYFGGEYVRWSINEEDNEWQNIKFDYKEIAGMGTDRVAWERTKAELGKFDVRFFRTSFLLFALIIVAGSVDLLLIVFDVSRKKTTLRVFDVSRKKIMLRGVALFIVGFLGAVLSQWMWIEQKENYVKNLVSSYESLYFKKHNVRPTLPDSYPRQNPETLLRKFGGYYPLGGKEKKNKLVENSEKVADFGFYYGKEWFWSEGRKLSEKLLEESINKNKRSLYGDEFQRYNYVVSEGEIYVAIWNRDLNVEELSNSGCDSEWSKDWIKNKWSQFSSGTMINVFPELTTIDIDDKNPKKIVHVCESIGLIKDGKKDKVGILDALSKHFMIAQRDESIKDYDPKEWVDVTVDYAGEILINIMECSYTINTNSGTYRPAPGVEVKDNEPFKFKYPPKKYYDGAYLEGVAKVFKKVLGESPKYIQYLDRERHFYAKNASLPMCK